MTTTLRKTAPWTYETADGTVVMDVNCGTRDQNSSRWIAERAGKIVASAPSKRLLLALLGVAA